MFGGLFLKECKKILKNITYYIFLISLLYFYFNQVDEFQVPQPNQSYYGEKSVSDPDFIIEKAIEILNREYNRNAYATYPIGILKKVTLNKADKNRVDIIRKEISEQEITYDEFLVYMDEIDHILGGNSNFSRKSLKNNARIEKTYEDAVYEFNELVHNNQLTAGYARVFCDYMGIILGIIPVFIAVSLFLMDKNINEVLYDRRISSIKFISFRYMALIVLEIIPLLLLGMITHIKILRYSIDANITIDNLTFIKYTFGWILPTLLVSTAIGLFFTILSDTPVAIIVQAIWWFIEVSIIDKNIHGDYRGLIPRHNTLGNYEFFKAHLTDLMVNRLVYTILAIVLVVLSIIILEYKRKGKLNFYGAVFRNIKSKLKIS